MVRMLHSHRVMFAFINFVHKDTHRLSLFGQRLRIVAPKVLSAILLLSCSAGPEADRHVAAGSGGGSNTTIAQPNETFCGANSKGAYRLSAHGGHSAECLATSVPGVPEEECRNTLITMTGPDDTMWTDTITLEGVADAFGAEDERHCVVYIVQTGGPSVAAPRATSASYQTQTAVSGPSVNGNRSYFFKIDKDRCIYRDISSGSTPTLLSGLRFSRPDPGQNPARFAIYVGYAHERTYGGFEAPEFVFRSRRPLNVSVANACFSTPPDMSDRGWLAVEAIPAADDPSCLANAIGSTLSVPPKYLNPSSCKSVGFNFTELKTYRPSFASQATMKIYGAAKAHQPGFNCGEEVSPTNEDYECYLKIRKRAYSAFFENDWAEEVRWLGNCETLDDDLEPTPLYELQSSAGHGRSTEEYVFELGYAIRNADDTIDTSRWQVDAMVSVYVGTPYCTPELRRVLDGASISAPKAGYDSQSQSYVSATFTLSAFQNDYAEGYWGTDVAYSTSLNFFTGDYDTSVHDVQIVFDGDNQIDPKGTLGRYREWEDDEGCTFSIDVWYCSTEGGPPDGFDWYCYGAVPYRGSGTWKANSGDVVLTAGFQDSYPLTYQAP